MEEVLACRACLATDTKLFSLHKHGLRELYADFSGCHLPTSDTLPQHVCNICCVLLLKYAAFRSRCRTSKRLLENALLQHHKITIGFIRGIDRTSHHLALPYKVQCTSTVGITEVIVKEEEPLNDTKDNVRDVQQQAGKCGKELTEENEGAWSQGKAEYEIKPNVYIDVTHVDVESDVNNRQDGELTEGLESEIDIFVDTMFKNHQKKPKQRKRTLQCERKVPKSRQKVIDCKEFSRSYNVDVAVLSKEEQMEEVHSRSESSNDLNSTYRCEECFKGFPAEAAFKNHMSTHDPITIGSIRDIDRTSHHLALPYKVQCTSTVGITEVIVKEEEPLNDTKDNVRDVEQQTGKCGEKLTEENEGAWSRGKAEDEIKRNAYIDVTHVDVVSDVNNRQDGELTEEFESEIDIFVDTTLKNHQKKPKQRKRTSQCERKVPKSRQKEIDFEEFSRNYDVEVVVLTKEEQMEEVHSRRESSNYLNASYRCEECFKGFLAEAAFKNHMIKHDPSTGTNVCEFCRVRYQDGCRLRYHLASHRLKFVCRHCKHVSRYRMQAKQHHKWHTGYKYVCKYCGASFEKRTSHFSHVRLQHPSEHTSCDICGETFIGEYGVMQHKKKAHKQQNPDDPSEHRCGRCGAQFAAAGALRRHLGADAAGGKRCGPNTRSCPECGESFNTARQLREHRQRPHVPDTCHHRCDECNKTFATEASHRTHFQRVHLNVKYRQLYAKRVRRRPAAPPPAAHERPTSTVCEICGKTYASAAALKFHQRVHGARLHQCPECPKKFTLPVLLQYHIRTHTGERPHKCPVCSKAFKVPTALYRHHRTHTGERPHACPVCGKRFTTSSSVKLHVRSVHMNVPPPPRATRRRPAGSRATHATHATQ